DPTQNDYLFSFHAIERIQPPPELGDRLPTDATIGDPQPRQVGPLPERYQRVSDDDRIVLTAEPAELRDLRFPMRRWRRPNPLLQPARLLIREKLIYPRNETGQIGR